MNGEQVDALVIGAGPAGLAAARHLRRLGSWRVAVLDRETVAGGVPRHCQHIGYGLRDLHRLMSGPAYARRYVDLAVTEGVSVYPGTTVTHWDDDTTLLSTSPAGRTRWQARTVLLATGCRERPRSARLVPGSRPLGVFTTGALQQLVHLHHQQAGRRAVVVGAEHVSFSAVHTLAAAGASVAAVITDAPRHQSYEPLRLATATAHRAPVLTDTHVSRILGRQRVEAVEVTNQRSGEVDRIACDTVVFTGDWVPDYELARLAGLDVDDATNGPVVDTALRTSRPGVFAAGNVLHPAETADIAALDGRHGAVSMHAYLTGTPWPTEPGIELRADEPLQWVSPQRLDPARRPPRDRFILRTNAFTQGGNLVVAQAGRVLNCTRTRHLVPNRSLTVKATWVDKVSPTDGPVQICHEPATT